jgi:deoxyadenosine kinase
LCCFTDVPVYYEPVIDNEYLADFYADMKKYSFPLQIYLLNKRFRQHQQIIWQGKGGVQDRTIYEDSVFAKMLRDANLMEERDYRTYIELFNNMANFMRKPNLIVHLDVTPEESLERIRMRSRSCESTITLEYLTNLHKAYEEFIQEISRVIPVIRVNWSKFRSAEEMAEMIKKEWQTMQNIHHITWEKEHLK